MGSRPVRLSFTSKPSEDLVAEFDLFETSLPSASDEVISFAPVELVPCNGVRRSV